MGATIADVEGRFQGISGLDMLNFNMANPLLYEEIGHCQNCLAMAGLSLPSRIIMNTQPADIYLICMASCTGQPYAILTMFSNMLHFS